MTPIPKGDSIPFPKSFFIAIYNEDKSKLLKKIDYNSFIKHIEFNPYFKDKPLKAEQWTLVIDSTLLDLKE